MFQNWLKTARRKQSGMRRRTARSWQVAEVLEDRTLLSATLSVLPDAEAFEADGSLNFTVALSEPVDLPVSVEFMTVDGTAHASGTALTFDGLNDFVQVDSDLSPAAESNALTLSAWVNVRGVNTDGHEQARQPILAKGISGQWEYALYVYDNMQAGLTIWTIGGQDHAAVVGGSLTLNQWHHVAGTYERGGNTNLYVDGVLVASSSAQAGEPGNGTRPVRIGSREDGQFLNASIDEVRIYDVALTQAEIQATRNEILTGDEPGLLASWRFEEGTGNVAHAQTSGHHDGLLGGIVKPRWTVSGDFLPGDYVKTIQTVTFNPGDPLTQIVSVPLLTDDLDESDETVFAFLGNVTVTGGVRDVHVVNGSGGETLYAIDTETDELATIDGATGNVTVIGSLEHDFILSRMAFLNGTIYAVTPDGSSPPNWTIVAIDPTDATVLNAVPLSINGSQPIRADGLAARDGALLILYDDTDGSASVIGEVEPATGVITRIVDYETVTGTNIDIDAIATDPDGILYSVDGTAVSGSLRANVFRRLEFSPFDVTNVASFDGINISLTDLTYDGTDLLAISTSNHTLYRFASTLPPLTLLDTVPLAASGQNLAGITSNFLFGVPGTIKDSANGPDISGWWIIDGQAAQVLQLNGAVTFINEHKGVSLGHFTSDTQVAADGWGNLAGEIVGDEIQWANGSVWARIPNLSTTAVIGGSSPVLVQQSGIDLRFTNERGDMSDGRFLSSTEVVAVDWGNLAAAIVGDDLQWDNGSVWSAVDLSGVPVNLAGAWSLCGENTTILQFGNDLLFINERGDAAAGVVVDATHVIATGWGNLAGTIDAATRRILWDNGSVWDRVPILNRNENWHIGDRPTAVSQLGVDFLFTNEFGSRSRGRFVPLIGIVASDWSLGGQIDFAGGRITWNNLSVWRESRFGNNDEVFADSNNWPWAV
jgi:hypothetical protein